MPDPECDLACQTKIIINGDMVGKVTEVTCEAIERFLDKGGKFRDGKRLVKLANTLEDAAFAFQRAVLEEMGFTGPWPHSLEKPLDSPHQSGVQG
jgi:hypothetical protein